MAPFVDYYEILEVDPSATEAEVTEALQRQRRVWFKRAQVPNQQKRHEAEQRMTQLDEAQRVLLDTPQRAAFDRARRERPAGAATAPTMGRAQDWLERAREYLAAGDGHSAAYAAKEATAQEPANHAAWALKAEASVLLGEHRDAVFEYREASRLDPSSTQYLFDLGLVYERLQEWQNALQQYEQAARLDPSEPLFQASIASVYITIDNPMTALPIIQKVADENPGNSLYDFYYALAINGTVFEQMTRLHDGSRLITTPKQADYALQWLTIADALSFDDAELRALIRQNLALAREATDRRWSVRAGTTFKTVVALAVLALCGIAQISEASSGAGLLFIVATIGATVAFYQFGHQPGWRINERETRDFRMR